MGRRREKAQIPREGKGENHGIVVGVEIVSSGWISAFKCPCSASAALCSCSGGYSLPADVTCVSFALLLCFCEPCSQDCVREAKFLFPGLQWWGVFMAFGFPRGIRETKGFIRNSLFNYEKSNKDELERNFCQCWRFLTRKCHTGCSATDSQQCVSI